MSKQKKPHRELNGPEKTGNTKNDPDREEWIIQEHREYGDPAGLRNILGDDYQILWEMKLESIPRLLSTPCTIESLVLVKWDWFIAIAMKRGEEFIRIMNFVKADYSSAQEARLKGLCLFPTEPDIDGVEEEGIEDRIRSVLDYYQRIIQRDDDEPLYYTDLPDSLIHYPKGEYSPGEFEIDTLGYIIGSIRLFESRIDSLLPKQLPPVPSEILENADPEDIYGIYSESTYWWWQKGKREIHIVGTGSAETFEYYEEEYYDVRVKTLRRETPFF